MHGLIGPNGSGKTTTLNAISGYYVPQQGRSRLKDSGLPRWRRTQRARYRIARTFQTPRLVGEASVLENVMIGGTIGRARHVRRVALCAAAPSARRSDACARRRWRRWQWSGSNSSRTCAPDRLQHSELRFVEIARALMLRPSFLLLDEPAAGLSVEEIKRLGDLIVDHQPSTAPACCWWSIMPT